MALTKQQKEAQINSLVELIKESKIVVYGNYAGLRVTQSQELKAVASENSTHTRVAKNRLVKIALSKVEGFSSVDTADLKGQIIYAFSSQDEVAPAQVLARFAKQNPQLELLGAIDSKGVKYSKEEVNALAALPSKDMLRATLVGTLSAPISSATRVLAASTQSFVGVLRARIESLN